MVGAVRRVFIETYGCQMNEADSEMVAGLLRRRGFAAAETAETADVVLLNTCAVRERAEERIFGRLGWLKTLKAQNPHMVLGVTGCMAERMRQSLLDRAPFVDLVVGPDSYRRLPGMIAGASEPDARPQLDVQLDRDELYDDCDIERVGGVSGWITVMRGCDKFCTFCIVPFVRGRERSLPPETVVRQAREMVATGFREVTLLGQTVSSYYERGYDFADLLRAVHEVEGLERIRFTSPYPNDFSDRLLDGLAELPKIGHHLHLPVQSGSDRILRDMRRGHTASAYIDLIDRVRSRLPGFAITTDLIVGYPGETEADFEATLDLVARVQFDGAFTFRYSEREGTLAARARPDDVPDPVKIERLQRLIRLQETVSRRRFASMVGRKIEVLVRGRSKKNPNQAVGRSSCFRTTVLDAESPAAPGTIVRARVTGATSHTLIADVRAA